MRITSTGFSTLESSQAIHYLVNGHIEAATNKLNRAPALVLGTKTFGKQIDEETAERILDYFLDSGCRAIDTAHDYGKGATEEILGRILTPERRQKIYLATKVNPWREGGLRPESEICQT